MIALGFAINGAIGRRVMAAAAITSSSIGASMYGTSAMSSHQRGHKTQSISNGDAQSSSGAASKSSHTGQKIDQTA